ncbi:MAG: tRNA (adenosine(37)-N6)-threonylcarbamoyltransferase complex transferase subunit TsaD [Candidatus Berkelbacteria bacterium]|nr:tRNA (adenosine(37)-N6)-threonylcarbamoyltransferase complex transferase subunit TsaD [Candidatus Berkelbacteria bacterium]
MKNKEIKILAIETSCDETCAAIICGANSKQISNHKFEIPKILSNVVSSQVDLHAKTGGVVPEVASRAHMESILPVIEEAIKLSGLRNLSDLSAIAVTAGPGLIGSLLVGFNAAKAIAAARNLPLVPVNHIAGHIYSAVAETQISKLKTQSDGINFPILTLTVSGGHTSLTLMTDHGKYQTIGETLDDAAGEAFDKVAKLLDLGYPGGPVVSKFAGEFRNRIKNSELRIQNDGIKFPRPLLNKPNFDFSFSGLKTAVLTEVVKNGANSIERKEEICWAFEEAAVEVLVKKTQRAVEKYQPATVILAGGVAANKRLREELSRQLPTANCQLFMPPIELCGDNAAMIGIAAYYQIVDGENQNFNWHAAKVDSNLEL